MKYVKYLLLIFLERGTKVCAVCGVAEDGWGLCIGSYLTDADSEEHHSQLWVNLGFWVGHGRCAPLSAGRMWAKQDLDRKFASMIDSFFMSCEICNWCTWILIWDFFFFTSIEVTAVCVYLCVCRQYLVAVPAVLESGAETKFCVSVLELTEPVVVNVTLKSTAKSATLMSLHTCIQDVHTCIAFSVSFPKEAFLYIYIYIYSPFVFERIFLSFDHPHDFNRKAGERNVWGPS